MFYSGMWRKVYAGIGIGEIRMWSGSNSVFDGNGLGIVGGDMDGWHLCNGVGGIVDLTNRFVVGSTVYPGQWQSNPDGQGNRSVGGEAVIQCQNLPDLWTTGWAVGVPSSGGPTLVMGNVPTSQAMDIQVTDLINNCHPGGQVGMAPLFYALAFVQFVGY